MLAYLFWHRPLGSEAAVEAYEHALDAFHRSLAHRRRLSACCYGSAVLPGGETRCRRARADASDRRVRARRRLRGLVPGRGLRSARGAERGRRRARSPHHPRRGRAPLRSGSRRACTALLEGEPATVAGARRGRPGEVSARRSGWRGRPARASRRSAELLGDGMDPGRREPVAAPARARPRARVLPAGARAPGGCRPRRGCPRAGRRRRSIATRCSMAERALARGTSVAPAAFATLASSSRLALGWSSPPGSDERSDRRAPGHPQTSTPSSTVRRSEEPQ